MLDLRRRREISEDLQRASIEAAEALERLSTCGDPAVEAKAACVLHQYSGHIARLRRRQRRKNREGGDPGSYG